MNVENFETGLEFWTNMASKNVSNIQLNTFIGPTRNKVSMKFDQCLCKSVYIISGNYFIPFLYILYIQGLEMLKPD